MGDADGRHRQNGDAHRREHKARNGGQQLLPRQLAQMHGKNQVARAKKHTEQRARHQHPLGEDERLFLHDVPPQNVVLV